ncbi:MAG: hypothetical protein J5671_00110 [Bacteroidaceae bacterium]|nr:hypothetical protein [Bacteroidaceae bacterium]
MGGRIVLHHGYRSDDDIYFSPDNKTEVQLIKYSDEWSNIFFQPTDTADFKYITKE